MASVQANSGARILCHITQHCLCCARQSRNDPPRIASYSRHRARKLRILLHGIILLTETGMSLNKALSVVLQRTQLHPPPTHHNPLNHSNAENTFVQSTTRQNFRKPSKPCLVGIHWIALDEYSQMSTHLAGF